MLRNPFYYGEFEYPIGSGIWYKGKHPTLVSREKFDKVQNQLKVPIKSKWGAKAFPYKRLLRCYSCGSGVVGEEKLKRLKNGRLNRHVYYHCSRKKDIHCKEAYVKENDLTAQLVSIRHEVLFNKDLELGLQKDIKSFVNIRGSYIEKKDNLTDYMEYVLKRGSNFEKTRLLRNIDSKYSLHNKLIILR